jgi:hypothetical protein
MFTGDGAVYDVMENYIPRDPPASTGTAPFRMAPVDQLLRTYGGGQFGVWRSGNIRPPYDKVIGFSADKLQVFSAAHILTDAQVADLLNRPDFRGDVLLIAGSGDPVPRLDANERLAVRPEVISFDANSLRVKVEVPKGGWLLYCDAAHPGWRATVNGRNAPVARAFLAYKAVPVTAGTNDVEFRFKSPARTWTFRLAALNALLWVLGLFVLIRPSAS